MAKKILVLSNMYPTPEHKTFGIFVKNQVEALRMNGNHVDVIGIKNPLTGKKNVISKYFRWLAETNLNLLSSGRKYDVIHAHYVFPTGMLALLYKKLLGKPFIVTAHGGDIDRMAKKNRRIRQWTEKILQEASHVVVVGEGLHQEVKNEYKVADNKLSIINMGVNRNVFKPYSKKEIRHELQIAEGVEPVLFVGNIIREKGLNELVEAFKLVKAKRPQAELFLIGASRNVSYRQELNSLIGEAVHFVEPVPQVELAKWMSAADVFVLPSHLEGFGLVAVEAMSCHTPVIGTDVGGLHYLLKDGSGLLVPAKHVVPLADAILSVLENNELKQQLIRKGELKATENDEKNMISKLETIYNQLSK
ncbi:MAG TPA: glycosyltransferase [Pseudoneobacillus sp.]|nr:glycosyltransferase [Pseudoneobacillus sp.]